MIRLAGHAGPLCLGGGARPVLAAGSVLLAALWLDLVPLVRAQSHALDPAKPPGQYHYRVWTTDEGLPQNSVLAIAQSAEGYLWVGTYEGVARFDGLRFDLCDSGSDLPLPRAVGSLLADSRGRLWVGSLTEGLVVVIGGRGHRIGPDEGFGATAVRTLFEDSRGRLWVGTSSGLYRAAGDGVPRFDRPARLPEMTVNAIAETAEGALWFATEDAGLYVVHQGWVRHLSTAEGLPQDRVHTVLADGEGRVWIGTEAGVVHLGLEGPDRRLTVADGLGSNSIRVLYRDRDGTVWAAAYGAGLTRIVGDQVQRFGPREGLTDRSIRSLFQDREGSLWFGTNGGLNRLMDGPFVTYSTRQGLGSDFVRVVAQTEDGSIWIGTDGGGVSRLDGGELTTFREATGFLGDTVRALAPSHAGGLWAAAYGRGIAHWSPRGGWTLLRHEQGLTSTLVRALYEDRQGVLWVGTSDRGVFRYDGEEWRNISRSDGLPSNQVLAIAETSRGDMWFATYGGGLARLDEQGIAVISTEEGLPDDIVFAVTEGPEGALWVGTQRGIARLAGERIFAFGPATGMPDHAIFQILFDETGRLWMSSNRGLYAVASGELMKVAAGETKRVEPVRYARADGLPTAQCNGTSQPAGWKSADGRLWFPTAAGLVAIEPRATAPNPVPPTVVVEKITADGIDRPIEPLPELPPDTNSIELAYTAPSLRRPERVRFRYRLVGFRKAWVDAGTRRAAFYTNLPPGRYRFEVTAANEDGLWTEEPAAATFVLLPHLYQRWWFGPSLVGLAAMMVALAYVRRLRHLQAHNRELREAVDAATAELRARADVLARAREEADRARRAAEAANERLRELDRLKTHFFSNISHEFRTPLTLLVGPLERLASGDIPADEAALRYQGQVMLRNAQRLLRLINQLLDLSKLESRKMQLERRRLDLAHLIRSAAAAFESLAESKGIDFEVTGAGEPLPAYLDGEKIEKILFNLLSNAFKFTPRGGAVTLGLEGDEDELRLRVSDTGRGIPADQIDRVFQRFGQASGSTSSALHGTGIGLSLVHELVTLHGGEIDVESALGEGTTFCVHLPRLEPPPGETESRAPAPALAAAPSPEIENLATGALELAALEGAVEGGGAPSGGPDVENDVGPDQRDLILVVEDHPDMRRYIADVLDGNFRVALAADGREGIERAAALGPDLIVTDLMMPRMSGFELIAALRGHPGTRHIPVIVLTGDASEAAKIRGLTLGADDYVSKPFSGPELIARIRALLRVTALERQLAELNAELEERVRAKVAELVDAQLVQQRLLPLAAPKIPGYDIGAVNATATELGGDYFDFLFDESGDDPVRRLGVIIADAAGHGAGAAMVAAVAKASVVSGGTVEGAPDAALRHINTILRRALRGQKMMTCLIGELDVEAGCFRFSNAGHRVPVVVSAQGVLRRVRISGTPLGMAAEPRLRTRDINLDPGDALVLFTDGAVEVENPEGEVFGQRRFYDLLRGLAGAPASEMARRALDGLIEFAGSDLFADDITMVVVKKDQEGEG